MTFPTELLTYKVTLTAIMSATLLSLSAVNPVMAKGSMQIINCTGTNVKILFFNNNDLVMMADKTNVNIDAGKSSNVSVAGSGKSKARVFKRQALDQPVMMRKNLDHNGKYWLTARGGEWRLHTNDSDCSSRLLK